MMLLTSVRAVDWKTRRERSLSLPAVIQNTRKILIVRTMQKERRNIRVRQKIKFPLGNAAVGGQKTENNGREGTKGCAYCLLKTLAFLMHTNKHTHILNLFAGPHLLIDAMKIHDRSTCVTLANDNLYYPYCVCEWIGVFLMLMWCVFVFWTLNLKKILKVLYFSKLFNLFFSWRGSL